mmetsp:Transcript_101952/g.259181  ORF Transcript_101952/g.259181 Transcript_101952/m.259181 type:complete len:244 (-) Transcript_101952:605-1336(-)
MTRSGAPLRMAKTLPLLTWPCTVSIHLFSELKGISKIFWFSGLSFRVFAASGPPWTSLLARRMATSVGEPAQKLFPSWSFLSSAPLLRMPQTEMQSQTGAAVLGNTLDPFSRTTSSRPSLPMAVPLLLTTTKSCTVISPFVRVPVLSEQKTETQPKVSTASILRTKTFRLTISAEANMREMVTVGKRPSGTWENKAHAVYWIISERGAFCTIFTPMLSRPTKIAIIAMKWTKCSIWISSVDFT